MASKYLSHEQRQTYSTRLPRWRFVWRFWDGIARHGNAETFPRDYDTEQGKRGGLFDGYLHCPAGKPFVAFEDDDVIGRRSPRQLYWPTGLMLFEGGLARSLYQDFDRFADTFLVIGQTDFVLDRQ